MTPFTRLAAAWSRRPLRRGVRARAALAQDSKSSSLARQLASALEAGKLDCIAAKDPEAADRFMAALYFPGSLLVVARQVLRAAAAGRSADEEGISRRLHGPERRGVGRQQSVHPGSGGRRTASAKRDENQAFDIVDIAGKQTMFNSDWKGQKLSEQDYMKVFGDADERYTKILTALLAQLKKTS